MATMQTTKSVVPEKYNVTRFKADCWFHIANHYRKNGTWLSFKDYQKVGDKTCKENVFTQVRDEMRLDITFNRPEAVKAPDEAPPKSEPKPAPPPEKPTAIANALINGLTQSAKESARERSKGPVTAMRRLEAEQWILAHLDSGYASFKLEFQEPELDNAWWTKIRNGLLHPPEKENRLSLPTFESLTFDPRMQADTRKVVKYLLTLNPDKIEGLTASAYMEKTRHKILQNNIVSAKRYVHALMDNTSRRLKGGGAQTAAPKVVASPTAAPKEKKAKKQTTAGNVWITVAEIDLAAYSTCGNKALRDFALELVKGLHPRGEEAKVVILAEPPIMEVRVPG